MKKLLLLLTLGLALTPPAQAQQPQMAVPGNGVAGMNVNQVVEMQYLTQTELADKIAHGWTSVLVPAGGTEIRGPHAILAVHTILAHNRAVEAAKRLGNTLVAPAIPYAVSATGGANANAWASFVDGSGSTAPNPGAIQVPAEAFKSMEQGVVESLAYIGFKNIFLMGDHGGGQNEMREVSEEMSKVLAPRGVKVYYVGDFYSKTHDDINMYMYNHKLPVAGHGGMMETAEMMYWEPTQYAFIRPIFKTVPYDGNSDDYEGWMAAQKARQQGGGRGAGGGGRGAGGGGAQANARRANNGLTGDPHPATKEIGADLAEIGISNTVNEIRALLAGR